MYAAARAVTGNQKSAWGPVIINFRSYGGSPLGCGRRPRCPRDTAVLDAATAALFDFHLQLQIEITRLIAPIDDVVYFPLLCLRAFRPP